jgi:flagellar biosynthetic protein FlhB
MDEGEQNKSEQPTSYKLRRSRSRGIVARGMDLGFLAGLGAFTGYAWVAGPGLAAHLSTITAQALVIAPNLADGAQGAGGVAGLLLAGMMRPLAFMAGTIFLVVLLFELAQTGVVFSAAPLKADFGRLNPGNGLKRLFSIRLLLETLKSLLKLGAYTIVAFVSVRAAYGTRSMAIGDARGLVMAMGETAFRLLAGFVAIAILFAVLDQFIARRQFFKQMRMSRREVRRELRDREGEPRIKQRRKQLHGEFAKASESLRGVRGADVVVTNPTRIAVALKYDAATMAAPIVVAKGAADFAARIRALAFTYGVLIVEDRALARDLFRRCAAGQPVPEDQYRPVAAIYHKVRARAEQHGAAHV